MEQDRAPKPNPLAALIAHSRVVDPANPRLYGSGTADDFAAFDVSVSDNQGASVLVSFVFGRVEISLDLDFGAAPV